MDEKYLESVPVFQKIKFDGNILVYPIGFYLDLINSNFADDNDVKINNLLRVKKYLSNNVFDDFDKIVVPIKF